MVELPTLAFVSGCMNPPAQPAFTDLLQRALRVSAGAGLLALSVALVLVAAGGAAGVLCQAAVDPSIIDARTILSERVVVGFRYGALVGAVLAGLPLWWLLSALCAASASACIPSLRAHPKGRHAGRVARNVAARAWPNWITGWLCTLLVAAAVLGLELGYQWMQTVLNAGREVWIAHALVVGVPAFGLLWFQSGILALAVVGFETPAGGLRAIRLAFRASRGVRWRRRLLSVVAFAAPLAAAGAIGVVAWRSSEQWWVTPLVVLTVGTTLIVIAWSLLAAQLASDYAHNRSLVVAELAHAVPAHADATGLTPDGPPLAERPVLPSVWRFRLAVAVVIVGCVATCVVAGTRVLWPHGGGWPADGLAALEGRLRVPLVHVPAGKDPWPGYMRIERMTRAELDRVPWLATRYSTGSNTRPFYYEHYRVVWIAPDLQLTPEDRWKREAEVAEAIEQAITEWNQLVALPHHAQSRETWPPPDQEDLPALAELFRLRLAVAEQTSDPDAALDALAGRVHLLRCVETAPDHSYALDEMLWDILQASYWIVDNLKPHVAPAHLARLDRLLAYCECVEPSWKARFRGALHSLRHPYPYGPILGQKTTTPMHGLVRWRNWCHRADLLLLDAHAMELSQSADAALLRRAHAEGPAFVYAAAPTAALAAAANRHGRGSVAPIGSDGEFWRPMLKIARLSLRVEAAHLQTGVWPATIEDVPLQPWDAPAIDLSDPNDPDQQLTYSGGGPRYRFDFHDGWWCGW